MSGLFFGKKGFLFTVSIIMFAATLVFFAQTYTGANSANESAIISSATPLNASLYNDDVSFGIGRVFGVSLDANLDANSTLFVSGVLSSQPAIGAALSSYESVVTQKLFPLGSGTKSVNLSALKDGKGEAFFGSAFEFDYNYSSSIVELFPRSPYSYSLSRLDTNLRTYGDLNRMEWSVGPVAGSTPVAVTYYDYSNYRYVSQSIDVNSLSMLVFVYLDSNTSLSFGSARSDANSVVRIVDSNGQRVDYSITARYPSSAVFPVVWNAVMSYSDDGFDSNAALTIRK